MPTIKMPAKNITLTAQWKKANTTITVEHYLQGKDLQWPTTATETETNVRASNGATVYDRDYDKTFTGYTFSDGAVDSITSAVAAGNGSTVLRLYYLYTTPAYTVTASIDNDGTITGAGSYEEGEDVTVEWAPAENYHITAITIDGTKTTYTQASEDVPVSHTFEDIAAAHTVTVETAIDEYTVTTAIDNDGTITATASYEVGEDATIEWAPAEGYHITAITIDAPGGIAVETGAFFNIGASTLTSGSAITLAGGTLRATGSTGSKASTRSSTPPWPGSKRLLSLAPALRLMSDSIRSPQTLMAAMPSTTGTSSSQPPRCTSSV